MTKRLTLGDLLDKFRDKKLYIFLKYEHKNGQISGVKSLETPERESKCVYGSLMHNKGMIHISGERVNYTINVWKKTLDLYLT